MCVRYSHSNEENSFDSLVTIIRLKNGMVWFAVSSNDNIENL